MRLPGGADHGAPMVSSSSRRVIPTGSTGFPFPEANDLRLPNSGRTRVPTGFHFFCRTGKLLQALGKPESSAMVNPGLSLDDRIVAFNRLNGSFDIWLLDTVRGIISHATSDPAVEVQPIWSSDGKSVVYSSNRSGKYA